MRVLRMMSSLLLFGCYASHRVTDAALTDGGPRRPPGAYAMPFAPEPGGGTPTALSDDQVSAPIEIGFAFRFFATTHTSLRVSSNGFVTFDLAAMSSGCCSGAMIPVRDDLNGIIAYAWTDLFPPGGGSLTHEVRGDAPNRRFVLTATEQSWCCDGPGRVTSQLVLHEGTDLIEVHTTRQERGRVYTQGVEDEGGTVAFFLPGRVAAEYALANDGVLFVTY